MEESFWDRFWRIVCGFEEVMKIVLGINVLLLFLLGISLLGIERGSASFVIVVIDLVILVPLIILNVYLIKRCANHVTESKF